MIDGEHFARPARGGPERGAVDDLVHGGARLLVRDIDDVAAAPAGIDERAPAHPGGITRGPDVEGCRDAPGQLAVETLPRAPSEKPVKIILAMTKRVLAAELGTVSETFSRTLAKFREQGLVDVKGKVLTVVGPARLAALLRRNLGE